MDVYSVNMARPFKRGLATNANTSSFASIIPKLAKPSGDGVLDISQEGVVTPAWMKIIGVGVGSDNDAYSLRIYGWSRVSGGGQHPNGGTAADLWVPFRLAELGFVLSAQVGVAGSIVPATEWLADTCTIIATGEGTTTANTTRDGNIVTFSPAADVAAGFAIVPLFGFEMLQWDFDQTTNTPTMNVLYAML